MFVDKQTHFPQLSPTSPSVLSRHHDVHARSNLKQSKHEMTFVVLYCDDIDRIGAQTFPDVIQTQF